nr:reverse transcriptase domain-containing protein [Tanacetum cinerariifolium]
IGIDLPRSLPSNLGKLGRAAYDATNNELPIPPLQAHIAPLTILPPSPVLSISPMFDSQDSLPPEKISPKDTKTSESLTLNASQKEIKDEFYNLVVKENDLKTYIKRFQDLETLCPTMVPNSKKLMEVFIEALPRSIEGNVTASKPQTLEEAINITQRLIYQDASLFE